MKILGRYSLNKGEKTITRRFEQEIKEIETIISRINAEDCKTKESEEKTMRGKILYSPRCLNKAFDSLFYQSGWNRHREVCEYSEEYYVNGYQPERSNRHGAFREMDFVKNNIGVEVQFGKYAFMVYNVCAKMTIFHNLGIIDVGIEIVPIKELAKEMSSGVSYFEQLVWDLEQRGVADIDIPVLILGIGA